MLMQKLVQKQGAIYTIKSFSSIFVYSYTTSFGVSTSLLIVSVQEWSYAWKAHLFLVKNLQQ